MRKSEGQILKKKKKKKKGYGVLLKQVKTDLAKLLKQVL